MNQVACHECNARYESKYLETVLLYGLLHNNTTKHTLAVHTADGDLLGYLDDEICGTMNVQERVTNQESETP